MPGQAMLDHVRSLVREIVPWQAQLLSIELI